MLSWQSVNASDGLAGVDVAGLQAVASIGIKRQTIKIPNFLFILCLFLVLPAVV
jgi:hypothetical protein